jgi:hypothetical protein
MADPEIDSGRGEDGGAQEREQKQHHEGKDEPDAFFRFAIRTLDCHTSVRV